MSKRIVLLQALTSMPGDVARIVGGCDEALFSVRLQPGEWSLADVLFHLVDVEERYLARLRRVIAEERPLLPVILPRPETEAPHTSPGSLLAQFEAARAATLTFLRELSPQDWQRPALHETFGHTTLRFLTHYLVDHDTLHLNQMIELQGEQARLNTDRPAATHF
jgi:uncharacterized damage-inducible protein DinB